MCFTCVAALWTMVCLTASLSMSLEYPPPITVATGTPFLTTVCITYRSLWYSPGVHKKFRNVDEFRLISILTLININIIHINIIIQMTFISQTESPELVFPMRVDACVVQNQVWAETVQQPWKVSLHCGSFHMQSSSRTFEYKRNKNVAHDVLTCLWRGTPCPPFHLPH